MVWHLKNLLGWGKTVALRASQLLEIAEDSAESTPLIYKLMNPETYLSI